MINHNLKISSVRFSTFTTTLFILLVACSILVCCAIEPTSIFGQNLGLVFFCVGIALTLCFTQPEQEHVCNCLNHEAKLNHEASLARLKFLAIVITGVSFKYLIDCRATDKLWGDVILTFNSALAGVYAGQGWLSNPTKPGADNKPNP